MNDKYFNPLLKPYVSQHKWPFNFMVKLFHFPGDSNLILIECLEDRLINVLAHMSQNERGVINLHYKYKYKLHEIAKILGLRDIYEAEKIEREVCDKILRYPQYRQVVIGIADTIEELIQSKYPDIHDYPVIMMDKLSRKPYGCLIRYGHDQLPYRGADHEFNIRDLLWLIQNNKLKKVKGIGLKFQNEIVDVLKEYGIKSEELV